MDQPHKPKNPIEAWLREQLEHAVECEGTVDVENPMYGCDHMPCPQCAYIAIWLKQHPVERKG